MPDLFFGRDVTKCEPQELTQQIGRSGARSWRSRAWDTLEGVIMTISIWWLIAILLVGAYVGITLMAVLAVAGRDVPLPDELSPMAGASRPADIAARPNRERRTRKRDEPKRRAPDPIEQQGNLQW